MVAGKPQPPLLEETIRRMGGTGPLMVGDRLDTDIEGAHNIGIDSLLVMTGVTGLPELAAAGPGAAADVPRRGPRGPVRAPSGAGPGRSRRGSAGGWRATVAEGRLEVAATGTWTTGGGRSRLPRGTTWTAPARPPT